MTSFADVDELPDPFGAEDEAWVEEDDEPPFLPFDDETLKPES